jgi:hypothetical protein
MRSEVQPRDELGGAGMHAVMIEILGPTTERLRFKARGNPYRTDDGGEDGKRPPPSFAPGQSRYSDGTAPALCLSRREGKVMETILIIVVLLFLFGGGGYYWRRRRG